MTTSILVAVADGVATLSLNRPAQHNALDVAAAGEFHGALTTMAADRAVKAVIVTGTGKAFSAGGDLRWVADHPGGLPTAFLELTAQWHAAVAEIHRMPKPVIAAINGWRRLFTRARV
jgi:2-(1,2-epoxy-1,2-dihydrophenyl)acetyl-CoA isomerase